jgi:hypothetical protein
MGFVARVEAPMIKPYSIEEAERLRDRFISVGNFPAASAYEDMAKALREMERLRRGLGDIAYATAHERHNHALHVMACEALSNEHSAHFREVAEMDGNKHSGES